MAVKITKYPPNLSSKFPRDKFEEARDSAIRELSICPVCGENRPFFLDENGRFRGIDAGFTSKTWREGFFKVRSMKVECAECFTCGCQYESSPYQWC